MIKDPSSQINRAAPFDLFIVVATLGINFACFPLHSVIVCVVLGFLGRPPLARQIGITTKKLQKSLRNLRAGLNPFRQMLGLARKQK